MDHELYEDEDEDPAALTLSGRTIAGRYKVIGLLGQGGSGRVYVASQIGLDRRVAIKVIRKDRKADPVTAARFMREARAAGRIASPNVVTLYDFGRDGDEDYIAMELLEGQSLAERMKENDPVDLREAVRIGVSITKGLRAAHAAGVLHRDLKPGNVFLCTDGTVKVLDFGIAKLIDDDDNEWGEPLTQVNRIIGTPVYMSPEAATRKPLGPATDLYGLGLMLYEMVVGEPPFRTGNAMKTLKAQVMEPAPRLSDAAPWVSVPAPLEDLVDALLQKDADARPRDANEVAERLERIEQRLSVATTTAQETRTKLDIRRPALSEPESTTGDGPRLPPDSEQTEVWSGRPWLDGPVSSLGSAPIIESMETTMPERPLPDGSTREGPASALGSGHRPDAQTYVPPPAVEGKAQSRSTSVALLLVASLLTGALAFGIILLLRMLF